MAEMFDNSTLNFSMLFANTHLQSNYGMIYILNEILNKISFMHYLIVQVIRIK